MGHATFRTKLFVAAAMSALLALAAAGAMLIARSSPPAYQAAGESADAVTAVAHSLILAFGIGIVAAGALAWALSTPIERRVRTMLDAAGRYARGEVAASRIDYGDDELGSVAQAFDQSARQAWQRLTELAHDGARMEAILTGMAEGVI